jgi:hypothetical protein
MVGDIEDGKQDGGGTKGCAGGGVQRWIRCPMSRLRSWGFGEIRVDNYRGGGEEGTDDEGAASTVDD